MVLYSGVGRFRPFPRFIAQLQDLAGRAKPSSRLFNTTQARSAFQQPRQPLFSQWSSAFKDPVKKSRFYVNAKFQQQRFQHGFSKCFNRSRRDKSSMPNFATGRLRYYYRGFVPGRHVQWKQKRYKKKCIHVRPAPHWKVKAAATTWIRKPHSACKACEMHKWLEKYRVPVKALPPLSAEQNAFRPVSKASYFNRIPTHAFDSAAEQSSGLIYLRQKVGHLAAVSANHHSYDYNGENQENQRHASGLYNSQNARLAAAIMHRSHHLFCPRKGVIRQYSKAASLGNLRHLPPRPGLQQRVRSLTSTSWSAASESKNVIPWLLDEYGHEFADRKKRDICSSMRQCSSAVINTYIASKSCRHVTCTTPGVCSFYPASQTTAYRLKKVKQPVADRLAEVTASSMPSASPARLSARNQSRFSAVASTRQTTGIRPYSTSTVDCCKAVVEAGHAIQATLSSPQLLARVTSLARMLLSLFPLSLRSRWMRLNRNAASHFFNRGLFTWSLLILPITLLAGVLVANISRTPISGRPRLLLMNREMEQSIVQHFYGSALSNQSAFAQWYFILRQLSGEEQAERGTLFGGRVIDPSHEWRQQWVEGVVRALEGNLGDLDKARSFGDFAIPEIGHALPSSASKSKYTVLLVDSPEVNAFSFGWPPGIDIPSGATPGVIVVFTGLIDSIMATSRSTLPLNGGQSMPSAEQTRQLAVLMSHELSHLLLGHTLEAYANKNLVWPKIRTMAIDVARTICWPVTALLGPFVNEGLSNAAKQLVLPPSSPESDTHVWIDDLRSASFSRKMELEADIVGLRLLANAGISPEEALIFWKRRCAADETASSQLNGIAGGHFHSSTDRSVGCYAWEQKNAGSSHPGNLQRLEAVEQVLQDWDQRKVSKGWLSSFWSHK